MIFFEIFSTATRSSVKRVFSMEEPEMRVRSKMKNLIKNVIKRATAMVLTQSKISFNIFLIFDSVIFFN